MLGPYVLASWVPLPLATKIVQYVQVRCLPAITTCETIWEESLASHKFIIVLNGKVQLNDGNTVQAR